MATIRANVGKIFVGEGADRHELAACEGIEVDYDFSPIEYHAGDRKFPIFVGHGNSTMTITVDTAESKADESHALETIAQNGDKVKVELQTGVRGGGIPATTYTNCVVTNYTVTSRQGDVIKARVILSKQADS